jgi:hypothetical protein
METKVKTHDFTEAEARRTALRMIIKGETAGDPVLLAAILEAQEEEIEQQEAALKYQGEVLAWVKAAFEAVRNAGDLQAPIPVYADALRLYSPPQAYVPTDGGSHVKHALGTGPRRRFGYQSDERGGPCDLCREPPDSHLCPIASDLGPVLDEVKE